MGGGKSRALCEEAFQAALDYPGIFILICRQEHTAIVGSTRKTMFEQVLPGALIKASRVVKSGGYDFIELPNGSEIHFVGLNDVVRFHSAEIGLLVLDEAHQIAEDDVMTLNTRLRQPNTPRQILVAANPENPGHWLWKWFIADAEETDFGYYKAELRLDENAAPIGDSIFVKALPTENPYLPEGYVERELAGLKEFYRQRYLEGKWVFVSGTCAFDVAALAEYEKVAPFPLYRMNFESAGIGDRARRKKSDTGRIRVFREPDEHRTYAIGADVATGRGLDYSSAYVIDLHDMAFVAEFHGKLDADLFATQLHFLGKWYNNALLAVESAGGWGEPVIIALRDGKGGRPPYPRLYQHRLDSQVAMDTVQRYGFPMNTKTRPQVISQLERAVRERALPWLPQHLVNECLTFCEFEEGTPSPRAQPGCHDDAVMAAAITLELYRQRGSHPERDMRIASKRTLRRRMKELMERDPFYRPPSAERLRSKQLYPPVGRTQ